MLQYINDLDSMSINGRGESHICRQHRRRLRIITEDYDLPAGVESDDIHAVYVDGKRVLRRKSLQRRLGRLVLPRRRPCALISPADMGETAVVQYLAKNRSPTRWRRSTTTKIWRCPKRFENFMFTMC